MVRLHEPIRLRTRKVWRSSGAYSVDRTFSQPMPAYGNMAKTLLFRISPKRHCESSPNLDRRCGPSRRTSRKKFVEKRWPVARWRRKKRQTFASNISRTARPISTKFSGRHRPCEDLLKFPTSTASRQVAPLYRRKTDFDGAPIGANLPREIRKIFFDGSLTVS